MQVVLSAISGVSKRIKEVAQTHKPLFGGEHILTGKEVCEKLYISPRTLQDYRDRRVIPYTQFAGKILYKASDLERLLENNYKNNKLEIQKTPVKIIISSYTSAVLSSIIIIFPNSNLWKPHYRPNLHIYFCLLIDPCIMVFSSSFFS